MRRRISANSARRLTSVASHSVSKRPDWLLDAAIAIQTVAADNGAHHWITGKPLGVVDVLVASQTAEHRLAQECRKVVANIATLPAIAEHGRCQVREAKRFVKFAIREQATIGRDAHAVELELDPTVENEA